MTTYTPAQLEAFIEPYPLKPLVLGANASMDHYETTVWERKVEAMLKRRAEAAPDLARLVLEKDRLLEFIFRWLSPDRGISDAETLSVLRNHPTIRQAMKETSDE